MIGVKVLAHVFSLHESDKPFDKCKGQGLIIPAHFVREFTFIAKIAPMALDAQNLQAEVADERSHPAVTLRAVGLGLFLVVALDLLAIYVRYVFHGSLMTYSHIPMAMLIVLMLMMIGLAGIGKMTGWVLSKGEWHAILAMGIVGATLPGFGLTGYLLGYITAPYYFVTEENMWAEHLHPLLPNWLLPSHEGNAVAWYYEGLPSGAEIPWDVWVLPLFWWTTVVAAAFLMLACVATVFRKQWVQNERLVFPAMAPLIDIASEPGDGKGWLPEFTRNRLFWIGFAIAFGVLAWNCINYFLPGFPRFPIYRSRWYWIDRQLPPIRGYFGIFTVFFSYFASLDVLFSIWLFDLVFIFEGGQLSRWGYKATTPYYRTGVYYWQTFGAFVVFVSSTFWVARKHLRDVLMKALGRDPTVDDSQELMSYRAACLGLLGSLAYLFIWLTQMNFDPLQGFLLLLAVIFVYTGMAKILADTGMPFTNTPIGPWSMVAPFFGRRNIPLATHAAYRFSGLITGHFKGLFLPALAHAGRVSEGVPGDQRRRLMSAIGLAFIVSLLFNMLFTVWLGYDEGAYNFNSWEITRAAERHFQGTVNVIKDPDKPPFYEKNPEEAVFLGIGGLLMAGLIYMRYRYVWWPLHPVGLAISGSYLARRTSFTTFLAWLIKFVMMKVGGPTVYRKSRPLFIGLLVGYILGVALSTGIDMIWFPERGHGGVHRYG